MANIITITNQKGGAGKTTTAAALAAGLSLKGFSVLLVDLDAQGNLSYTARAKQNGASALGVLCGEVTAADAIQHTASGDIIASSRALAGAELLINDTGKEYRLKEALEPIGGNYDYIVIDTPPALGILTINALTASQGVIIPAQADIYSLQGAEQLAETIKAVKKYCNPDLKIKGLLLTKYNARSVLSRDVAELAESLAQRLGTTLFKTTIRDNIAVREAQLTRQTLQSYAPRAKATEDYKQFTEEFLRGEKGQ